MPAADYVCIDEVHITKPSMSIRNFWELSIRNFWERGGGWSVATNIGDKVVPHFARPTSSTLLSTKFKNEIDIDT